MAQPTPYDRLTNFQNDQALAPSDPYPAPKFDQEYNAIKITLDEILQNLQLIQADDGGLQNGIVDMENLSPDLILGFSPPVAWVTGRAYNPYETVVAGDSDIYMCIVAHVSENFAADLAAGKWQIIATGGGATETFQSIADVESSSVNAPIQTIQTLGYYAANGRGFGRYVRVPLMPVHPGRVRSVDRYLPNGAVSEANGGWWELRTDAISVLQLGAKADGVIAWTGTPYNSDMTGVTGTFDDTAFAGMASYIKLTPCKLGIIPPIGVYALRPRIGGDPNISAVWTFTEAEGDNVTIYAPGTIIAIDQRQYGGNLTWVGSGPCKYGAVFRMNGCWNFKFIGNPRFVGDYPKAAVSATGSPPFGWTVCFMNATATRENRHIEINIQTYGLGIAAHAVSVPTYEVSNIEMPIIVNGGTGYAPGATVQIPHVNSIAGAVNAVLLVTTVGGGGVVTGLAVSNRGVYPVGLDGTTQSLPPILSTEPGFTVPPTIGTGLTILPHIRVAATGHPVDLDFKADCESVQGTRCIQQTGGVRGGKFRAFGRRLQRCLFLGGGCDGVDAHVEYQDPYLDQVDLIPVRGQGTTNLNCTIIAHPVTLSTASGWNNQASDVSVQFDGYPTKMSNIQINTTKYFSEITASGLGLLYVGKFVPDGGGVIQNDPFIRGHRFDNLVLNAVVFGGPSHGSPNMGPNGLMLIDPLMPWAIAPGAGTVPVAEQFRNWKFNIIAHGLGFVDIPSAPFVEGLPNFFNSNCAIKIDGVAHTENQFGMQTRKTVFMGDSAGEVAIRRKSDGAEGPILRFDHQTANVAASDATALIRSYTRNASGTLLLAGMLRHLITPVTLGAEGGLWTFHTLLAGALAEGMRLGAGLHYAGLTDPGAGNLNFAKLFYNNEDTDIRYGKVSDTQVITATGIWTKPAWATANPEVNVEVYMMGGAGGGGSGARRASGTASSGGAGGGGSGVSFKMFQAGDLAATEVLTIGLGGAGGPAIGANDTNGTAGTNGQNSLFSSGGKLIRAGGGVGGAAGVAAGASTGGAAATGSIIGSNGGSGASGALGGAGGTNTAGGPTGGGAGAGVAAVLANFNGGTSGIMALFSALAALGGVGSTKTAPEAGSVRSTTGMRPNIGCGGGGGWANIDGTAGDGAAGGSPGGGGGGGASSINGNLSGAGGQGGNGVGIVITWG